jgi:hypothetical protein
MCDMVVERMKAHGRGRDVLHLHYPKAGHALMPYLRVPAGSPAMSMPYDLGGGPELSHAVHVDAWPQVVAHLRTGTI